MQSIEQDNINHQVTVILLQKIIELLDKEEEQPETLQADEVRAALHNELSGVIKAVKSIPEDDNTDILKELKNLKKSFESIEFKPVINVTATEIPEIKLPVITVPDVVVPPIQYSPPDISYTPPDIHVASPTVNLPAPVVNVEPPDLSSIIKSLESNLNKLRTNSETRPLAVRLSDGQAWLKEIKTFADKAQQAFAAYPGPTVIKSANGEIINPATVEGQNKGMVIPYHNQQVINEADPNNVTITYKLNGTTVATKSIVISGTTTTITVA